MKFILCFVLFLSESAFSSQRESAASHFYHATNLKHSFQDLFTNKHWKLLDKAKIRKAFKVPSQVHGKESLRSWSCGPNSAARSLKLMGLDICEKHQNCEKLTDEQYADIFEQFAHSFPKSFGSPGTDAGQTASLAAALPGLAGMAYYNQDPSMKLALSTLLVLGGLSPFIAGNLGGNAGAPPDWFADHLKKMGTLHGFDAQHLSFSKFNETEASIKIAIDHKTPVIPLVVFEAMAWHYFVIIGYNDMEKSYLIMDTDGSILKIPYKNLEILMNPGFLTDDDSSVYLVANFVSRITKLGNYNLIRFHI